ncbi:radical SAM protein [Candidatus Pelagibacter sp.]|nr:radical SAM protein [Candidatus Pelagibacter sp.]|tara:strand:- start:1906 stop:3066 length:1161 start_codon:yes stop_codon:yes gene_type:complete
MNLKNMEKKELKDVAKKYKFENKYFEDPQTLKDSIINKTVIPHQVEFQPGPLGKKICWLSCPYCYGESAENSTERPDTERLVKILNEIADGGVNKVTFAGWATDPLNSKSIDKLLETAIDRKMIFGFNTKPIKVSDKFVNLLKEKDIHPDSWISLSIDSGSNEIFNKVHGMNETKAPLYDRVLSNVMRIKEANIPFRKFDVSAAYLMNKFNSSKNEIENFIKDFKKAGCNLLRFSFAQPPRGLVNQNKIETVPLKEEKNKIMTELKEWIISYDSKDCRVLVTDPDTENDIFYKNRTLPCVARFIYPTVGFDGRLYQCSQSAAPNFKETEIGDLKKDDFWELYYNYDVSDFENFFKTTGELMNKVGCRCDRKEHIANTKIQKSKLFV